MEKILRIFQREYNPEHPILCFDETSKEHHRDVIEPLPAKPGSPRKFDSEYQRNSTSNLFMIFEPLAGKRYVEVTDHRKAVDFADMMKLIVDELYPGVPVITVVMDNLNTHGGASLYKRYSAAEAERILNRLRFEFTPKHGSWLNPAESELSHLSRQCLDRRIPDQATLKSEVAAWQKWRNKAAVKCAWQFRVEDARVKLASLYPKFSS